MSDADHASASDAAESPRSLKRAATLFACAAIGGLCAAVADVVQKDDASAVSKITSVAARNLDLLVKPLWVLMGLVLLAMLLCFVFQPRGRRSSFGIGAGVIATIMTVTPYQQPLTGLPVAVDGSRWLTPGSGVRVAWLGGGAPVQPVGVQERTFRFTVSNSGVRGVRVTVSLFVKSAGQEYQQTQIVPAGAMVAFPFAPRGVRSGGQLYYTVTADGAAMARDTITADDAPLRDIAVKLTNAAVDAPMESQSIFQRLQKRLGAGARF